MITIHVRDDLTQSVLRMCLHNRLPTDVVCDDGTVARVVVRKLCHEELQQSGYLSGVIDRWIAEVELV